VIINEIQVVENKVILKRILKSNEQQSGLHARVQDARFLSVGERSRGGFRGH
jgi:hypothetical protein